MALKNASKRGGDHVRQRLTSDGQKNNNTLVKEKRC